MRIPFTKMHGLGNDFMVVRAGGEPPPAAVIASLADRHTGVGFDQLLWLQPSARDADIAYRVFNADGSTAEQCGNGARCIAALVAEGRPGRVLLEHQGGLMQAEVLDGGRVAVEIGVPRFEPDEVPFVAAARQDLYRVDTHAGSVDIGVVSMGNPHAVITVDDIEQAPVSTLGAALERHERFPNRANIGFMQVLDPRHVLLRVFERGAGETRACGTGACAAVVVGRAAGRLDGEVDVTLPGGTVMVRWQGPGESAWLTGEAVTVFEGTVDV